MNRDNNIDRRARLRSALVKAGRDERASDALRTRLLAVAAGAVATAPVAMAAASSPNVALAKTAVAESVTTVAPAASGGTMAAVASANGLVGWKVLAVLLAIGVLGSGATFFATRENVSAAMPSPPPPSVAPQMTTTPAATLPVVRAEPTPSAPEPIAALSVNDLPTVKATPPVRVAAQPSSSAQEAALAPAPAAASPAARLTEETRSVGAIRASLQKGDTREALRLLDAYEAEFAHGALGEEAEVLRIETLIRAGNRDEAANRASRFLRERPSSPHAARVRTMTRRLSVAE